MDNMNKELHPYQQRMVCEAQELDNRIANLEEFLAGDLFPSLPEAEQTRMRIQLPAMKIYSQTLHERIKAFAEGQ